MASTRTLSASGADDGWQDCGPPPPPPPHDDEGLQNPSLEHPPRLLDAALMRRLFPRKDAGKQGNWLATLASNEFETIEDLSLLDSAGWASLDLPLSVKATLRQHAEASQPASGGAASAASVPHLPLPPPRIISQVDVIVVDVSASMRARSELDPHESQVLEDFVGQRETHTSTRRTREDISKLLFHTLVDKALVFELAHAVGLVAFGEKVMPIGSFTRDYETFHDELGRLDACQGRTRLFDAIKHAADLIDEYVASTDDELEGGASVERRIFVLTDGEDNASTLSPWELASTLQARNIRLDAIPLAFANGPLAALCHAAGGVCFNCVDQEQAIGLFEREATLRLCCRETAPPAPIIDGAAEFEALRTSVAATSGAGASEIRSKPPPRVFDRTYAPKQALAMMAQKTAAATQSSGGGGGGALRRAMKEYEALLSTPPEGWQVFVSADNPLSWKAVLSRGEASDEWKRLANGNAACPYEGGTWLLSVDVPPAYPFDPPRIRFVTPVFHCNVSVDGLICMAMLQEQWSPALSIGKALAGVRALLLAPDADHPLDAFKGTLYRDDKALYMAEATTHTRAHACEGFGVLAERYHLAPQGSPAADAA